MNIITLPPIRRKIVWTIFKWISPSQPMSSLCRCLCASRIFTMEQSELSSSEQLGLCYVIAWSAAIGKYSTSFPLCLENIIFNFTLLLIHNEVWWIFRCWFSSNWICKFILFHSSDAKEIASRVVEYHDNQLSDQKVFESNYYEYRVYGIS